MKNPEKHSEITQAVENTTGERELTQRAAFAYEEDQEAGTDVVYTASQKEVADTVHDMIVSNLDQHITIAEFARSLHVSPTQIKVSFSKVYGLPVYTYARMQRMTAASKLLAETDQSVLEIAGKYGYENGSKFAGAFRSVMGTSPSEYRRRIIWEKENNAASGMHNREDAEKN
ncbi:MAG: helix-turn-helix transcriptional regulator [Lachnospiraceae bacterium]|nr:helix-turn-helix transcriptional regulator [Lachnospiraceae bacterium]